MVVEHGLAIDLEALLAHVAHQLGSFVFGAQRIEGFGRLAVCFDETGLGPLDRLTDWSGSGRRYKADQRVEFISPDRLGGHWRSLSGEAVVILLFKKLPMEPSLEPQRSLVFSCVGIRGLCEMVSPREVGLLA